MKTKLEEVTSFWVIIERQCSKHHLGDIVLVRPKCFCTVRTSSGQPTIFYMKKIIVEEDERMQGIDICKKYIGLNRNDDKDQIESLLNSESIDRDISIDPSTTPWCAAWCNFCERSVGNDGTGKLNARSFLDYGTEVALADAQEGDIVVFDFEHDGVHGHVTYFSNFKGMGQDYITCLGGNQSDNVQTSTYGVTDIAGIRRP